MQRNPAHFLCVGTSPDVCISVHRSQDNQLCTLVTPDLARRATRVALIVSWVRDSPRALPLERVISQSVPLRVPSPWAHHHQDLQLSPHVDIWLLSPATGDASVLSTIGLGRLGNGFEEALTPSPLPPCNGAPELAGTTITSFRSSACLVTVGASPAPTSAGRPASGVPSWPPPDLPPRVQTLVVVESCEPQRYPTSYQ